ncbi:type II toxin-antitoxin system VapC family toxin [Rhizobium wuzhouense]|uniref:type II toxin-antitoxin system VapC family toxin n=1 Tax=Rhizobium wuzhouense TaxID=1986026 RepID=UPI003CC96E7F
MKITADTNVLLRAAVGDDPGQQKAALAVLRDAEVVAVTLQALCEFVCVLSRHYGVARADIAAVIRRVLDTENVETDRAAVHAGFDLLNSGGDFADGVIAFTGRMIGASISSPSTARL